MLASQGIRGKGQGRLWIRDASPAGGQALSSSLTAFPLLPADKETETLAKPTVPQEPDSGRLGSVPRDFRDSSPILSSKSLLPPHQEAPGH